MAGSSLPDPAGQSLSDHPFIDQRSRISHDPLSENSPVMADKDAGTRMPAQGCPGDHRTAVLHVWAFTVSLF